MNLTTKQKKTILHAINIAIPTFKADIVLIKRSEMAESFTEERIIQSFEDSIKAMEEVADELEY